MSQQRHPQAHLRAQPVFDGSDAALTRSYLKQLEAQGPVGVVAAQLFRAQKASTRAKLYHGGIAGKASYSTLAYNRKQEAIDQLSSVLSSYGDALQLKYGWKLDPLVKLQDRPSFVLYVELPQGQVSFHSPFRAVGPDFDGEWDKQHRSEQRILEFCDAVLEESARRSAQGGIEFS